MNALELHRSVAADVLPEPALHIAGSAVTSTQRGAMDRIDPTTGQLLSSFPIAGEREVDQAVQAARKALPAWRRMPADERRRLMWNIARAVERHADELNQIGALETGIPLATSGVGM